MFILPWNKSFETGIALIDSQHKDLFELINLFALKNFKTITGFDVVIFLSRLTNLSQQHFPVEEAHMIDMNYPLTQYHKALHDNLKFELERYRVTLDHNMTDRELFQTILNFASQWLTNHVAYEDLIFFDFAKQSQSVTNPVYEGYACILSLSNQPVSCGVIRSVTEREFKIELQGKKYPKFSPNDRLQIKILGTDLSNVSLDGVVYHAEKRTISLFALKNSLPAL